jgi:hypothetical protein
LTTSLPARTGGTRSPGLPLLPGSGRDSFWLADNYILLGGQDEDRSIG